MANKTGSLRNRREAQLARKQAQRRRAQLLAGGGAVLVVALLLYIGVTRRQAATALATQVEVASTNRVGPADAPVQLVEFGDFGCPSCRAWHSSGVKEALLDAYGDQISFTFRHFPVITRQSPLAAQAAQCAGEQEAFWGYHDFLYENLQPADLTSDNLLAAALGIGLEGEPFASCLGSGKYGPYVAADQQEAVARGARGTPSFYINDRPVGFSYQEMAGAVEQILDGAVD